MWGMQFHLATLLENCRIFFYYYYYIYALITEEDWKGPLGIIESYNH